MEINQANQMREHANQVREHASQMNAMQNRLIAMERAQSSKAQHKLVDSFMRNQLAKSFFKFVVKWDLIDQKMNK
jgi:hypothetical protein